MPDDDAPQDDQATPETPDGAKPDGDLGDGGKSAIDKERAAARAAEKRAKAAEAELQKLKDKDLSDQDRKDREAKDALTRAEAAEARALRLEVAADKGLDLKLAGRLQGSTREELEADADTLRALLPAATPATGDAPKAPPRLVPDRGQGAKPTPIRGGYDAGAARAKAMFPSTNPSGPTAA